MDASNVLKTLSRIASEYGFTPKTLSNHIQKNERLKSEIASGLQTPRKQKLIYDEFGYPPNVSKKDYEDV
jgi:predicted transcriptional regulator